MADRVFEDKVQLVPDEAAEDRLRAELKMDKAKRAATAGAGGSTGFPPDDTAEPDETDTSTETLPVFGSHGNREMT